MTLCKKLFFVPFLFLFATNVLAAAFTSNANGNWNASATWNKSGDPAVEGTDYPGNADTASVGHTVTVNGVYPASGSLGAVTITSGGKLTFLSSTNTKLTIAVGSGTSITINSGGELEMGTAASPIGASYTAEIACNPTANAACITNNGTIELQGNALSYWYDTLASNIAADDVHFHSTNSTGWTIGDEIVVPTTSTTRTQTEKVAITGISGTTVYIDSNGNGTAATPKFTNAHTAAGGYALNITRNVIISSNGSYFAGNNLSGTANDLDWVSIKGIKTNWDGYAAAFTGNTATLMTGVVIRDATGANITLSTQNSLANASTDIQKIIFYNNTANLYSAYFKTAWNASHAVITWLHDIWAVNNTAASVALFFAMENDSQPTYGYTAYNIYAIANSANGIRATESGYFYRMYLYNIVAASNASAGIYIDTGSNVRLKGVKSYYNAYGLLNNGNYDMCNIIDHDSYYGSDGTNTKANTTADFYFGNGYDGAHKYVGTGIDLKSSTTITAGVGTFELDDVSYTSISYLNHLSDRHLRTLIGLGTISDQTTAGETSAASWCNSGSGTCLVLNPTTSTAGKEVNWTFKIPVTASTDPQLKFYVKKSASAANPTLNIDVYDSDDDITKLIDNASITLTDSWAQYSVASITPTNTGYCRVVLKSLDGSTTGDIGIDDISIVISGTTATDGLNNWAEGLPLLQFDRGGGGGGSSVVIIDEGD